MSGNIESELFYLRDKVKRLTKRCAELRRQLDVDGPVKVKITYTNGEVKIKNFKDKYQFRWHIALEGDHLLDYEILSS